VDEVAARLDRADLELALRAARDLHPPRLHAAVARPGEQVQVPCHGSGYTKDGINFEGPTPRPLERVKITLADDGQLVVDKAFRYRYELGQWDDPNAFVKFSGA